jgi:retron-type reverse transcriptase
MVEKSIFQRMCDEKNLRTAWIKARYHASTTFEYFDKYAYDLFEEYLDENISALRFMLLNGTFNFSPLRIIVVPKKSGETRKLYFPTPQDNTVIQAMLNIIGPIFEQDFSIISYGNRLNIADNESKDPFLEWYNQYTQYINQALKITALVGDAWYQLSDIFNFYPSIDKATLKSLIAEKVVDANVLQLIDMILKIPAINSSEQLETIPGIPPGTIYAHFFANIYLDKFDKFMEARALIYSRYVDDFCFACSNEGELRTLEKEIESFIKNKIIKIQKN